jgi:hypothetical protein
MPGLLLFILICAGGACVCALISWTVWLIFCLRAAKAHGLHVLAQAAPEIAGAYRRAAPFSWVSAVLTAALTRLGVAARAALAADDQHHDDSPPPRPG